MKLDDLIEADKTQVQLDADLIDALRHFGFIDASYSLYSHPTHKFVALITAKRPDGSSHSWTGTGKTPAEAEAEVIDAIAKWILQQPLPFTP